MYKLATTGGMDYPATGYDETSYGCMTCLPLRHVLNAHVLMIRLPYSYKGNSHEE